MLDNRFLEFLKKLGYSDELLKTVTKTEENIFSYQIEFLDPSIKDFPSHRLDIKYVYTPTKNSIFDTHLRFWNQNNVNTFIAISESNCYIINAKEKPDQIKPLNKNIQIKSFDYGINSQGFEKEMLKEISKDAVDSSYFFDFVSKHQKSTHEVDKDLLLNLIALRNDLEIDGTDKLAYSLILKCLFVKYLEDRRIYEQEHLLNVLNTEDPNNLISAFNEIKKINGDIFKHNIITEDEITPGHMEKLARFFSSDYRSRQRLLFPYQFDKIPVQLISNVYEAFLDSENKRKNGIYYTPSFVVNFMLSHTLKEKLSRNPKTTVLDPACGSGAFLVESFKMIIDSLPQKPNFKEKQHILQNQLFGIDRDANSLQIAAFSLYLVLLETENPEFIRKEIENSHPILPSLIGKTLIPGNSLTDDEILKNKTFDCIVANPPWGNLQGNENPDNEKERNVIGSREKDGLNPIYANVSDYERCQAFLLRAGKWGNNETVFSMIVKNSIFLNEKAADFRKNLLKAYQLSYFYELSALNKILFKKRTIGEIENNKIEIGANEPCAVVVFHKSNGNIENNSLNYISPKLTPFSEKFQILHYTQKDINNVAQRNFYDNDLLWKVLFKGDIDDFKLITKVINRNKSVKIVCSRGFEPKQNMKATQKETWDRTLITSKDFDKYHIKNKLVTFNWNQTLRCRGNEYLFCGDRILIAYRPIPRDGFKLRCIYTQEEMIFRNDILSFKSKEITNYLPYLAILNSAFAGYYIFKTSVQWSGGVKREALRTSDIKLFPFPEIDETDPRILELIELATRMGKSSQNKETKAALEKQIDELVFDLYRLLDFEKQIIREFYQINVERKKKPVTPNDFQNYVNQFRRNFKLFLDPQYEVNAVYSISSNVGAVVCFQIVPQEDYIPDILREEIPILNIVKKNQLQQSYFSRIVNEDKVKIYDENRFYIIKSNYFKDWTERQALKDANEEIGLLLKNLPEN